MTISNVSSLITIKCIIDNNKSEINLDLFFRELTISNDLKSKTCTLGSAKEVMDIINEFTCCQEDSVKLYWIIYEYMDDEAQRNMMFNSRPEITKFQ